MNHELRRSCLCFPLVLFILFILFPHSTLALENPQSYELTVSASIGEGRLTLFGYTSPQALVQLQGRQVAEEVIAGKNGYFFFDRIFLPRPNPQYPELCLNSIDTQSRISFPNCLPPLPTEPFDMSIGPVLLPPTFTLTKGSFLPQEQVVASGLTIPNSKVMIYLANDVTRKSLFSRLVPETFAYNLPQYQTQSDQDGRFEFNLPTIKRSNWKIFAGANWQNSPTPKSNTLNFKIQSWWEWLWLVITNVFGAFLRLTKPYLWLVVILLEIIMAIWLLVKRKT